MLEWLSQPWPWYVAGPLIGLAVPILLVFGDRAFGLSTSFEDICAATFPAKPKLLDRDWRDGAWRLALVGGLLLGGAVAAWLLAPSSPEIAISEATRADLAALGIEDTRGLAPAEVFSWAGLRTLPGFVCVVVGGLLVGFGTRWASGCTSGHAITGLANFQLPSLLAVIGFFVGGLISTWLILPVLF